MVKLILFMVKYTFMDSYGENIVNRKNIYNLIYTYMVDVTCLISVTLEGQTLLLIRIIINTNISVFNKWGIKIINGVS